MPERYVVRGDDNKILSVIASYDSVEPVQTQTDEDKNVAYLKCRVASPPDLVHRILEQPSVRDVYPANLLIVEMTTDFIPQEPSASDTHDISNIKRYHRRLERYHEKIAPLFETGILLDKPTSQNPCIRFLAEDSTHLERVIRVITDSEFVTSMQNIDGIRSTSSNLLRADLQRPTIEFHYAFARTSPNSSDTYDISGLLQ